MSYVIYCPAGLSQKIHSIYSQLFSHEKTVTKTMLGLSFRRYENSSAQALKAFQGSGLSLGILSYPKYFYLKMQYNWTRFYFESHPNSIAVTWNGMKGTRSIFMSAAKDAGVKTLYLENACFNGYVAQDSKGINYGNSLPRQSDFYYKWIESRTLNLNLLNQVKSQLTSRKSHTSEDINNFDSIKSAKYIFCALQVEDDTQMRLFSPWIKDLKQFIDLLCEASNSLPEGWQLRLKEHPSSKKRFTKYIQSKQTEKFVLDNKSETLMQIDKSSGVLTINSSVGLQAFLYNKPVLTLGKSFYSFDNMAHQVEHIDELKSLLANPEKLKFNKELREIFLNYILSEYYIKCDAVA